ncbi:MAG TPA: 2-oxoacid:acceptor oxidoreductase family protein [Candidatus Methylomirabilis sp.]|nr:2-oxoacid:acceptor oxidoreductase family protein [Candidatus Methylomirabilis sp.]
MTQSGKAVKLPVKNDLGFFEIRMESIGGLGANVAGKILTEAAILGMGMNGAGFASYGSEKKGTPVKAFVRICEADQKVRINSPVEEPHVLAIFHEALAKSVPVTAGTVPGKTTVILNTRKTPAEARDFLKLEGGKVGVVDAMEIAMATGSRVNMVMVGATMKAAGFFDWKAVEEAILAQFGRKYASLMKANMDALKRGFDEVKFEEFRKDGKYPSTPFRREEPKLGYGNAPMGGAIYSVGNMRFKDLSTSRTGMIPLFLVDKCTNCGECDVTCPDYCFVFERGKDRKTGKDAMVLQGINYQYCKGCLRCTHICKFGALVPAKEAEQDMEKITVKHKFLK